MKIKSKKWKDKRKTAPWINCLALGSLAGLSLLSLGSCRTKPRLAGEAMPPPEWDEWNNDFEEGYPDEGIQLKGDLMVEPELIIPTGESTIPPEKQ